MTGFTKSLQTSRYYLVAPARALGYFVIKSQARYKQPRKLFVFCHMRCGSTALVHVLSSNPAIAGVGESFITYRDPADFETLAAYTYWGLRKIKVDTRYVLDKIVHNRLTPDLGMFARYDCKVIFMHRDPAATIRSIVHHFPGKTESKAADYLLNRYPVMDELRNRLPEENQITISFQDFVGNTQDTLGRLSEFLELDEPLSPYYTTGRYTGRRVIGDSSSLIGTGVIQDSARDLPVSLEPSILDSVMPAYRSYFGAA
jgi:hypothetical protein